MPDRQDGAERPISRRALLSMAASGLAATTAGCSSDDPGTPTPTSSTRTDTPLDTPTDAPTTAPPETATATPTQTRTTESDATPTQTPTPRAGFDPAILTRSPSSRFAPTAAFGTADWLANANDLRVMKVTTRAPSGKGSLRRALEASGPRIVVFEVGGVIDLRGETINTTGDLYVAGQTAPSPGITIIRGYIEIDGDDTIVQHVRSRSGDRMVDGPLEGKPAGPAGDPITVSDGASNVVVDHCSVSWGTDENMSIGGGRDTHDVTLSNNLIAEGLSDSPLHPETNHGKGTLVNDDARKTAVVGNVYAHHDDRHPRIKEGAACAVVNNLVYDFREAIEMGGSATILGNYYKEGATPPSSPIVKAEADSARAYVAFNRTSSGIALYDTRLQRLGERPVWPTGLTYVPATKTIDPNLSTAGARPADRTDHDRRIVTHVRENRGEIIDSQSEVGGYPELDGTERALDPPAPGDGLASWLYQHTKAVELEDAQPPGR